MNSNTVSSWLVAEIKRLVPELEGRVFPDAAAEGTGNPCLVYQMIEDGTDERLDRGAIRDGMLAYQIRIYAGTRQEANALRERFRQGFQNRQGEALAGWRLEGTGWGSGADTFEKEMREYGALGVLEVYGS